MATWQNFYIWKRQISLTEGIIFNLSRWNYFHRNWNFKIWLYYGWLMPFRKVVLNKRGCLTSNNYKVKITDCKDNVNPISHYHSYENSIHSYHFLSFYLQYILKKAFKKNISQHTLTDFVLNIPHQRPQAWFITTVWITQHSSL